MGSVVLSLLARCRVISHLVLVASLSPAAVAQTASDGERGSYFALLNLVKSPSPISVSLGGSAVGIGEMPFGFFTGTVNWVPLDSISISAPDMKPAEIKPDGKSRPGERPLYVAIDAKEPPAQGGLPVALVKTVRIPDATSRPRNFIDAINLSSKTPLEVSIGRSNLALAKGKRTRISEQPGVNAKVMPDGPEVSVTAPEEDVGSAIVIVFHDNQDGSAVSYTVVSDSPIVQ